MLDKQAFTTYNYLPFRGARSFGKVTSSFQNPASITDKYPFPTILIFHSLITL